MNNEIKSMFGIHTQSREINVCPTNLFSGVYFHIPSDKI
uniref:Uncharacterized protein n=1 Tax=Anguilla anguilla TaxID=7936 RepID=A0A0E9R1A0_ANGAN